MRRAFPSLILAAVLAGCSPWTTAERITAATAVGCAIGDGVTTYIGKRLGYSDANVLMNDVRFIVPVKAVSLALAATAGELDPGNRLWWWRTTATMNCAATSWNGIQIGKVLIR